MKKAASAIDALATYMYVNRKGCLETYSRIQSLIPNSDIFWSSYWLRFVVDCSVLKELFDAILLSKVTLQWSLSRPLLSVFLVYENGLNEYCQYLCKGCDESQVELIKNVFKDIMNFVDRSLDASSREAFSMMIGKWSNLLGSFAIQRAQL